MTIPAVLTVHPADEESSKRRQILDGARRMFMTMGFDAASMGEIAKAAGVSKGTLYVYFADKTALFEAIVEEIARIHGCIGYDLDLDNHDVAGSLANYGTAYMELLCRPEGGSAVRTVMAIAERMPDIGRRYYSTIIAGSINRLAQYLAAQSKLGLLDIADHELAAEQFLKCCQATLFLPFVLQAGPSPTPERIAYVIDSAVRIFLAAYQAKPKG
ncbi:TetR/AcrR family transcriptional regulator [Bradyrhizobium prioriisuperbiae]|uniref:TetR/AcrR family transcriptional regulator n=1 Tax=Bradyrhizobium prioriisuperbiae TaxID=2854389 RepID=UPI0028EBEAA8|nr:TetR/AcrR family transcriptional regulator [Bradyrhizobium prioritasuperba]